MSVSRRQLLGGFLAGGAALGASGIALRPGSREALNPNAALSTAQLGSRDAYNILRDTLRLGRRIQLGGKSAYADPNDPNIVIVQVKVLAMFISRFLFKFGAMDTSKSDGSVLPYTGPSTPLGGAGAAAGKYGVPWGPRTQAFSGINNPNAGLDGTFSPDTTAGGTGTKTLTAMLMAAGIDRVSTTPRWANLRLNGWFASILDSGKAEAPLGSSQLSGSALPFPPASAVAVQMFASNESIASGRGHNFVSTCVTDSAQTNPNVGGDLAHHLDAQGIVNSPLGIVTFASGLDANGKGGFSINDSQGPGARGTVVFGSNLSTVIAQGQPVASYVDQLDGLVRGGHVDMGLVQQFDGIRGIGSSVRKELVDNQQALLTAVGNMQTLPTLEQTPFFADATSAPTTAPSRFIYGANEGLGSNTTDDSVAAKAEFLAQCRFVQESMRIPGLPFRNFVLSLNVNDLNGHPAELSSPNFELNARSLSPLEGMRQLALGLNLLAQTIQAAPNGAKIFVIVSSDGGRTSNMVDSTISPGIILGPGGQSGLSDFLYANYGKIADSTDPYTVEPAEGPDFGTTNAAAQRATRAGCAQPSPNPKNNAPTYVNAAGTADNGFPSTGGLRVGLIRYLEGVAQVPSTTTGGLGASYKLQTNS